MNANPVLALALILCAGVPVHGQTEASSELSNGINLIAVCEPTRAFCSVALACPLPQDGHYAGAALLKYLIWGGGGISGRTVEAGEHALVAMRFGGSIDAQLTPDALILTYELPAEHLSTVFDYLSAQWESFTATPEHVAAARTLAVRRENEQISASALRPLLWEIQRQLWRDTDYPSRGFGSRTLISRAGAAEAGAAFELMRRPEDWSLVVVSPFQPGEVHQMAQESLGELPAAEFNEETGEPASGSAAGRYGTLVRLQTDSAARFAAAAYRARIEGSADLVAMQALAEYLRRCPDTVQLELELGQGAEVHIGFEAGWSAGMLYLVARLAEGTDQQQTTQRLRNLVEQAASRQSDQEAALASRKALTLVYWNRRRRTGAYALWRANMAGAGFGEDNYLEELSAADLRGAAGRLIDDDRMIRLITVPR